MTAPHGTPGRYQAGCDCKPCWRARKAQLTDYHRRVAEGHEFSVSSERSRRKMNALRALGWSMTDVAKILGVRKQAITNALERDTIRATTAERLDQAYDALEMKIPPDNYITRRTKAYAAKAGHLPPLAWEDIDAGVLADQGSTGFDMDRLDMVLVERCVYEQDFTVRTTPREKVEITRLWLALGRSNAHLCRLTGWRQGQYLPSKYPPQEAS